MNQVECSSCRRKSYTEKPGEKCLMAQPDGLRCDGTFIKT